MGERKIADFFLRLNLEFRASIENEFMDMVDEVRRGAQCLVEAAIPTCGPGNMDHFKKKTLGCARPRSTDQGASLEIGRLVVEI